MICGKTSDFMDHSLPKHFVSAHGASHHVWAPGPPPSKSGAECCELYFICLIVETTTKYY